MLAPSGLRAPTPRETAGCLPNPVRPRPRQTRCDRGPDQQACDAWWGTGSLWSVQLRSQGVLRVRVLRRCGRSCVPGQDQNCIDGAKRSQKGTPHHAYACMASGSAARDCVTWFVRQVALDSRIATCVWLPLPLLAVPHTHNGPVWRRRRDGTAWSVALNNNTGRRHLHGSSKQHPLSPPRNWRKQQAAGAARSRRCACKHITCSGYICRPVASKFQGSSSQGTCLCEKRCQLLVGEQGSGAAAAGPLQRRCHRTQPGQGTRMGTCAA